MNCEAPEDPGNIREIEEDYICDGLIDCKNGIDEYPKNTNCPKPTFKCNDGKEYNYNVYERLIIITNSIQEQSEHDHFPFVGLK